MARRECRYGRSTYHKALANDLWLWKQECPDPSPDAFIFPNSRKRNGATKNGFIRTDNYRAPV